MATATADTTKVPAFTPVPFKVSKWNRAHASLPSKRRQVRLWSRAVFIGYRRARRSQNENVARLRIEGVTSSKDAHFYVGKKVAYFYYASHKNPLDKKNKQKEKRVIFGKITGLHGSGGVVRSRFQSNLPSDAIGNQVRVFLYPSRI